MPIWSIQVVLLDFSGTHMYVYIYAHIYTRTFISLLFCYFRHKFEQYKAYPAGPSVSRKTSFTVILEGFYYEASSVIMRFRTRLGLATSYVFIMVFVFGRVRNDSLSLYLTVAKTIF